MTQNEIKDTHNMVIPHNLHTHTTWSDGIIRPKELIELAIEQDIKILGITDHAYTKKLSKNHQVTDNIGYYLDELKGLKKDSKIKLLAGLEIDLHPVSGIDPKMLPFNFINQFDYVVFEYVNTKLMHDYPIRDISEIIEIRDKFKIPVGLAHNNLEYNFKDNIEDIGKTLFDNEIFVELNQTEGLKDHDQDYHYEHFSEKLIENLRINNVKFFLGNDFHEGLSLSTSHAEKFADKYNLSYPKLVR